MVSLLLPLLWKLMAQTRLSLAFIRLVRRFAVFDVSEAPREKKKKIGMLHM